MRRWLILGLIAGAIGLMATSWNGTYEAIPNGATDLASDLDTFIKSLKAEVRQRLEVEHEYGGSTKDNGLHTLGSARAFVQAAAPTDINGGTAARGQYNSAAGADGGTALTTQEINGTDDIGQGRLWIDTDGPDNIAGTLDDQELLVWNQDDDQFEPVITGQTSNGLNPLTSIIYNNSFEITDGTGSTSSTTVPAGWAVVGTTPTFAYPATAVSEGTGSALRTTASGSTNQGVRQAITGLKASTNYTIRVRAKANAGDHCSLTVGDGVTSENRQTTTDSVYETLELNHTTTSTPATVNVDLLSVSDTDVCEWDNVTVQERLPVVAPPGPVICFDRDSGTGAAYSTLGTWDDAGLSCAVTPPGPGYIIKIQAQLVATHLSGNAASLAARIRENNTTTRSIGIAAVAAHTNGANHFEDIAVVPVFYSTVNPTPGTTLTFTLEGTPSNDTGPSWAKNVGSDGTDDLNDSANLLTTLQVELIPPN